jgi:4,5-dihydroxyphthalate decarboxylase
MSTKLQLTLAAGDYDSIRALKEGTVEPDGIELTILTDMTAEVRHARMLRGRQFDVAELSMSNYMVAKDNGLPFIAIPVFLHRRFRHGFVFVNTSKGIGKPTDLIGKKVGVGSYHATANLWMRGILEHEFDLPHKQIHWFKEVEGKNPLATPARPEHSKSADGKNIVDMLLAGELDAVIDPKSLRRSQPKTRACAGYFPLPRLGNRLFQTHRLSFRSCTPRDQTGDRRKYPWVPESLMQAFEESKNSSYKRMRNPRIVPLAWFRSFLEEQEEIFGSDPWIYGLGESIARTSRH